MMEERIARLEADVRKLLNLPMIADHIRDIEEAAAAPAEPSEDKPPAAKTGDK